ncbi:hypothetical protein, partial [Teichococcus rhizosphaerae]
TTWVNSQWQLHPKPGQISVAINTVAVMERWAQAHPEQARDPDDIGTDYFDRDWSKFHAHAQEARELDETALRLLTVEELADLEVLFYIGRDRVHGEHYEEDLGRTLAEHRAKASLGSAVHHLMSKTNLLDAVVDGARAVGRPSLAAKLRALRPRA